MLILAISLFVIAIFFGFYLLFNWLINKKTKQSVGVIHGVIALLGLVTLTFYCFFHHQFTASILVLLLAGAGGGTMFFLRLTGNKIPKIVPIIHGLIAICGFVLLVLFASDLLNKLNW